MKIIDSIFVCFLFISVLVCCQSEPKHDDEPEDEVQSPDEGADTIRITWEKNDPWPFDMPSVQSLRASQKKVFAHYFTQFPISIENLPPHVDYYATNYMSPTGNSAREHYGGYLRNRPLPRTTIVGAWENLDMEEEVRRAIDIGLDGFACDLLYIFDGANYHRSRVIRLMNVANSVDPNFKILIMPDMEVFRTSEQLTIMTEYVKELSAYPAAYRLDDGRLVISPYNAHSVANNAANAAAWWSNWLDEMRNDGIDIAFLPLFQSWQNYANAFRDISYGMSDWGWASPKTQINGNWLTVAARAREYAQIWMHPIRPQDIRPGQGPIFWEAGNSELYRVMWEHAIMGGADWVHLITWNDYSEHTCMAPSVGTQYSFYDLTAYYTVWFKTGVQPTITEDALYYFYRRHSTELEPAKQTSKFQPASGSDPTLNTVELLAFLTAPAKLEIQTGDATHTMAAPAGITSFQVPIKAGTPVFRMYREEQEKVKMLELTGGFEIKGSISYQDFLYYGGSSTREPVALDFVYKLD